ncbi:MAG: hypothetical protein AB2563_20520 [Candidatus Thiodiazotropha endolucinida]
MSPKEGKQQKGNRDIKRSTIIAYLVLFILALSLQGCGDNGGSSGNPPDIGGQSNKDPTAEYTAYSYAGGKTQTVINEDLAISAVSGVLFGMYLTWMA